MIRLCFYAMVQLLITDDMIADDINDATAVDLTTNLACIPKCKDSAMDDAVSASDLMNVCDRYKPFSSEVVKCQLGISVGIIIACRNACDSPTEPSEWNVRSRPVTLARTAACDRINRQNNEAENSHSVSCTYGFTMAVMAIFKRMLVGYYEQFDASPKLPSVITTATIEMEVDALAVVRPFVPSGEAYLSFPMQTPSNAVVYLYVDAVAELLEDNHLSQEDLEATLRTHAISFCHKQFHDVTQDPDPALALLGTSSAVDKKEETLPGQLLSDEVARETCVDTVTAGLAARLATHQWSRVFPQIKLVFPATVRDVNVDVVAYKGVSAARTAAGVCQQLFPMESALIHDDCKKQILPRLFHEYDRL